MDLVQWQLTTQRSWITPYLHFVLLSRWCEHQPHVTKLHPIRQMEQSPLLNIKFQVGLLPERDVPVCREWCWAGKAGRATPDVAVSDSCHRECWCLPRSSRREDIHCCASKQLEVSTSGKLGRSSGVEVVAGFEAAKCCVSLQLLRRKWSTRVILATRCMLSLQPTHMKSRWPKGFCRMSNGKIEKETLTQLSPLDCLPPVLASPRVIPENLSCSVINMFSTTPPSPSLAPHRWLYTANRHLDLALRWL